MGEGLGGLDRLLGRGLAWGSVAFWGVFWIGALGRCRALPYGAVLRLLVRFVRDLGL